MKKILLSLSIVVSLLTVASCDKDYNSIGSDIIGDGHYEFDKYEVSNLIAYSKPTGPVQSNNLGVNSLGIFNNPVFGITKASLVSQIELISVGQDVGFDPVIDSVYLYIPYYSEQTGTSSSGEKLYKLKSVFGYNEDAKFKLEVFQNKYVLNNFDPTTSFETEQKYFSDQKPIIEAVKGDVLLNDSPNLEQNDEFFVSNKELYIYKTDGLGNYVDNNNVVLSDQNDVTKRVIRDRRSPGIWLDLNKDVFKTEIFDEIPNGILVSDNAFKSKFKGLFFNVEETSPGVGTLAMLNLLRAELKVIYRTKLTIDATNTTRKVLSFQMGYGATSTTTKRANSINFIENTESVNYANALSQMNNNQYVGDSRMYLKGGDGAVAFIDLFGTDGSDEGDLPDELDELRANKWLVNQALLTFYVDRRSDSDMALLGYEYEPERIYVYDAVNNVPIVDYYADESVDTNDSKKNKSSFGGILQRDVTKDGIKYTIRLSEYIDGLLNSSIEDLPNKFRLGVSVIENINVSNFGSLKSPISIGSDEVELLPTSSVMNPLGTILYGSNIPESDSNYDKRLKLEIYYTKPN